MYQYIEHRGYVTHGIKPFSRCHNREGHLLERAGGNSNSEPKKGEFPMAKNDSKQQEIQKQSNKKNRNQGQVVDKKLDGDNFPAT